jgi:hypothetical protein
MVLVILVKTTSWNRFRTKMTNLKLIHYMLSRFENNYKKRTQNDLSRFYAQKGLKKKKDSKLLNFCSVKIITETQKEN